MKQNKVKWGVLGAASIALRKVIPGMQKGEWSEVGGGMRTGIIRVCDQYTVQGDAFSRAIREGGDVPVPLEDAIANMAVIEGVFRASESRKLGEARISVISAL